MPHRTPAVHHRTRANAIEHGRTKGDTVSEQHDPDTSGEWTPPPAERYASVWPHTLGDYEKWPDAVAVIQAGGALVVTRWGLPASVPLKIYAPGAWVTVEHVGDYTGTAADGERYVTTQDGRPFTHKGRPVKFIGDPDASSVIGTAPGETEPAAERTGELPRYRDPIEQLDPDLLDAENGDVNHRSGVGVLVPRQAAPGFGTADPGEGGADPKAVAAAEEPTEGDQDDTSGSLARFVLGVSWDRPRHWLQGRSWRKPHGAQALTETLRPIPTHLLSLAQSRWRIAWLFLAVSLPLLLLVLTPR